MVSRSATNRYIFTEDYLCYGVPTNLAGEWGERRHMSPNDASISLCDYVAERKVIFEILT